MATEVRTDGDGAKAAADPIKRKRRDSFMALTRVYLCVLSECNATIVFVCIVERRELDVESILRKKDISIM